MQTKTILFDLNHNEMLNPNESEYSSFLALLQNLNLKIKKVENKDLTKKALEDIDILIIYETPEKHYPSLHLELDI